MIESNDDAIQAQRADRMTAWGNAPGKETMENTESQRDGPKLDHRVRTAPLGLWCLI